MSTLLAFVAGPLLALLGVLVGHRLTRTSAHELDRCKREETMRLLRWATELAVDDSPTRRAVGVEVVQALLDAPILDADDVPVVVAVFTAVAHRGMVEDERSPP